MKRVLLVDQHSLFRQILALVLKWNTDLKQAIEADSLADARRILANSDHRLHLAIVDLDLAEGDGFELIRELRGGAPEVPVLAITLRGDVERRELALRAGAKEVLTMAAAPKEITEAAKRLAKE